MDVKSFASRVAGVSAGSGSVSGIAELIALILPILLNLPCFKPKTAAEKQQWIEDHPNMARNHAIRAIRDQKPDMRRREAGELADRMLEGSASLSDADFVSVCRSCEVAG